MIARIKVLTDLTGPDGQEVYGREFVALVTKDKTNSTASIDLGGSYAYGLNNWENMDPQFEIIEELQVGEVKEVEKIVEKEVPAAIKRSEGVEGYAIVPICFLDEDLANRVGEEYVINSREVIAMYGSSLMEINKGDVGPKSLNAKLYRCLSNFVEEEVEDMLKKGAHQ